MSDEERRRSVSRERSLASDREEHNDDQPPKDKEEEFKCFIGGIPWQMTDSSLRDGKQTTN
jgi:hypothetical protein